MSDARPESSRVTGRALLAFGVVCAAGAATLAAVALWPSAGDEPVLVATPASLDTLPVTLPPATSAPPAQPPADSTPTTTTSSPSATTSTIALSPLAELLGVPGSAIPPSLEPRVQPRSLKIGDLDLVGPVRSVGLEDDGELEVPDETEIGWYRYGASPGNVGATVLAAHVSWNGALGPFHQLGTLEPGALVNVELEDGSERTYQVIERAIYDKDELPRERIWRTTGDETLVLITCGGSFNPDISRYRENIVVYAVPIAARPSTAS